MKDLLHDGFHFFVRKVQSVLTAYNQITSMNEQAFVKQHEESWRRLAVLCDRAESSPAKLSAHEFREFLKLYRMVSTDLSLVRTRSSNLALTYYLNELATRAYGSLYRQPQRPLLQALYTAAETAAQTFRRRIWFIVVSASLFVFSAFLAAGLLQAKPESKEFFIPGGFKSSVEQWKSGKHPERDASTSATMTGFYASNNPTVAVMTASVGAASMGTITVYMLFTNGVLIGTLASEMASVGKLGFLFASILPHGVPEISGLFVSGAAGLLAGYALINPGRRKRGDALKEVGKDMITLVATSVTLMFIAAPIEGFFSFNPNVPSFVKLIVVGVELLAWISFWTFFGRPKPDASAA